MKPIALALCLLPFAQLPAFAQDRLDETVLEELAEPEPVPQQSLTQLRSAASARRSANGPVWYAGCDDVRILGLAPLYRGQPGYREGLDSDLDGVACEPYPGALQAAQERASRRARRGR